MSSFRFRLQRVLELRERSEQQAAGRLAVAREAADAARATQSTLEALREEGVQNRATPSGAARTVGQLHNHSYMIEQLNRQIQQASDLAEAAAANASAVFGEFTVAVQARRVLGRLRERQQQEWHADVADSDRKLMDSIALARFVRGASNTGPGAE